MSAWHIAMLAALPFMFSSAKMRTWVALAVAGVIPWLLPPMIVPAYIVTDALAGAIILRKPAGCAQRAIGACFAMLVMFHVGFLLSHAGNGTTSMYYQANVITGWVQFALLAAWGLADAGKALLCWGRIGGRVPAPDARA